MPATPNRPAARRIAALLALLALCALAAGPAGAGGGSVQPDILILNSYHPGFPWSDNELAGLTQGLQTVYPGLVPRVEHLDAKRFPAQSPWTTAKTFLATKYRDFSFDLIVALDNPALELLRENSGDLFPGTPVVFAGINDYHPDLAAGLDATGVAEVADLAGTLQVIFGLRPDTRRVLLLHDQTTSGLAGAREAQAAVPAFAGRAEFTFLTGCSFEQAARAIAASPPDTAALILSFATDAEGLSLPVDQAVSLLTRAENVPVFALHEPRLGHGVVGGSLLGGQEHGRRAAGLALRVLAGESPRDIPVDETGGARFMFDHRALARFGIPDAALPAGSVVVGKPESILDQHRNEVVAGASLIAAFALLSAFLTVEVRRRMRTEARLRRSEEQYRLLAENTEDVIWTVDDDLRFTYISPSVERLLGQTPAELIEADVLPLSTPQSRHVIWATLEKRQQAEARGECSGVDRLELEQHHRDGSLVWVEVVARRLFDTQGRPSGFIGVSRNIAERKRAEKALRASTDVLGALWNLSFLSSSSANAIFDAVVDALCKLSGSSLSFYGFVNEDESVMTIHAWSGDAMRECRMADKPTRFPVSEAGVWGEAIRRREPLILNDYSAPHPAKKGRPAGHVALDNLLVIPFFSRGRIVSVAAVANRATGYGQDDVAQLSSFLNGVQMIAERQRFEEMLTRSKEQAEAANKAKGEFLANMSHELRTPLNGVLGMLQLLDDDPHIAGDNKVLLETAMESGRSLLTIISDILSFAQLDAGKLAVARAPADLREILDAVIRAFSFEAKEKGLELLATVEDSVPGAVLSDAGRLRQILLNLLTNALKFTTKGQVAVNVSILPLPLSPADRMLLVTVSDTGIGIPDDKLDIIFEPFTQVDGSLSRKYRGTGIGLGIVRQLVRLMGGTICIDSVLGEGTTFHVTVRCGSKVAQAARESVRFAPQPDFTGLRVLLAEDDRVNRFAATRFLERLGCKVLAAENGQYVLAALEREDFDCILMDVQMPVMDGIEATRAIRSSTAPGRKARTPIVAMTAHAMPGDRESFLAAGMDGYIAKPVDMDELARALSEVLKRTGA